MFDEGERPVLKIEIISFEEQEGSIYTLMSTESCSNGEFFDATDFFYPEDNCGFTSYSTSGKSFRFDSLWDVLNYMVYDTCKWQTLVEEDIN
jgi:hypothetical protein